MKKLTLTIILAYLCVAIQAQTTLIDQDFSSSSGTTAPSGWSILTSTGDALIDVWHFDNPGRREPNSPIVAPYAVFDSDKLSDNSQAEEVYLLSPAFDATTSDDIILEFDQYFKEGLGGSCAVEVFNGTDWVNVYSNSSNTANPHHSQIDISSNVRDITLAQIRFKWTGDYSWFWIIDNVKVSFVPKAIDQFTEQTGIDLQAIEDGSLAWGDYDNDDDLDILLTGGYSGERYSKIYRNNGDNSYTEQTGISLTAISYSSVAWGDYDADGDLDILMTGSVDYANEIKISKIYRNNGDNTFTEQSDIALTGVSNSSVAWGDYDNDGDLDILLTGAVDWQTSTSKIYQNNGDNSFIEQTDIDLTDVSNSSVAWGDYDNDGYLDILLTGYGSEYYSKIYRNTGNDNFTEQIGISLAEVRDGSVAWGDYDNDGFLDILLTGYNEGYYTSKIYRNNGNNSFTEQTEITLAEVGFSSVAWGDYDNDGDLDILLTGYGNGESISKIYTNNGDHSFSELTDILLPGLKNGSVLWGDYDNDNDLDILLSGAFAGFENETRIFKNNSITANTLPSVPTSLNATVVNQEIEFSWDEAIDSETPGNGLSYNIVVGSTSENCDIISPMSNTDNGYRKIAKRGSIRNASTYTLKSSLAAGTYYWGVQSVDHCYEGSDFATSTFTISDAQASYLEFSEITTDNLKISWTRGNKEKCAVFMKQDSMGLPNLLNGTTYNADTVFSQGSQAGDGWYCIYNGSGDSVTVSGLRGSTEYRIMVIEYSGTPGGEIYLAAANSSNPQNCFSEEQFTSLSSLSLQEVSSSSVAWGDYNNDGYLDFILTGEDVFANAYFKMYRNNGDNTFIEQTGISIPGIKFGSVAWGDYDNDGYLDILVTGSLSNYDHVTKVYRNNGNNSFSEQTSISLAVVTNSSVDWGDYDNDGYLDILLTGYSYEGSVTKIYQNIGNNAFAEQTEISIPGFENGSSAFGDYDSDGDLDILLTGLSEYQTKSKIYQNNGDNSFTAQENISLAGVTHGSVAWGDYDNDGDIDILLSGALEDQTRTSKIYRNNGDNSFSEQTQISIPGVDYSSVAWGDYDNDGYLDILVTGRNVDSENISKIYRNNGNNNFIEQRDLSLPGVNAGSVAWGDFDNDKDLDILITGYRGHLDPVAQILRNNNFSKNTKPDKPSGLNTSVNFQNIQFSWDLADDSETPQAGLSYSLAIGSSSGTSDVFSSMTNITTGFRKVVQPGTFSVNNTFTFNSSLAAGTYYWGVQTVDHCYEGSEYATNTFIISDAQAYNLKFSEISTESLKVNWTRGSEEKCAVFMIQDSIGQPDLVDGISYSADTIFSMGTQVGDGWYCVYNGTGNSVIVSNLLGGSTYKIMVIEYTGTVGSEMYLSASNSSNPQTCYTQEQFTEQTSISLEGIEFGTAVWGDYDNDDDLDILLSGSQPFDDLTKIYRNNGNNTFTDQTGITFPGIRNGDAAWGDYDNDGYLDILLSGESDSESISKIYRNNGNNSFTEQSDIFLPGLMNGDAAWGDYDNDGDLDILLSGSIDYHSEQSSIFRNDGGNCFTEMTSFNLTDVSNSSVAWGDYNNDSYLDILLTGIIESEIISKIYKNNGDNTFTEQSDISLTGVNNGSAIWGDYDNDGYLDILLTGVRSYPNNYPTSIIYRNNGDNSFTEQTSISLTPVMNSTAVWGDYDNDGYLDILLTGSLDESLDNITSKIYHNNGDNSFTQLTYSSLTSMYSGSVAWGDYDSDGDLDVLLTGRDIFRNRISKIFRNNSTSKNTKPSAPTSLNAVVENQVIQFNWDDATDAETPQAGLSYNIVAGTSPGASDIFSPMSHTSNGWRKIVQTGNLNGINSLTLNSSLPAGTYNWGIQSIDKTFEGSEFALSTFTITDAQASYIQFSEKTTGSLKIKWTRGNKEKSAVFMKQDSIGLPALENNTSYIADTLFMLGSEAGDGWYCVYNGTGDSVIVTGLQGSTEYKAMVIEYSGASGEEEYLSATNSSNPQTFYTQEQFTELTSIDIENVAFGAVDWGDYDNDGDLDILLTGENSDYNTVSKIYRNEGGNTFAEQTGIDIDGIKNGDAEWGDYDNDGDLDFMITGSTDNTNSTQIFSIYRNNGDNSFTEQTDISLPCSSNSSIDWGDYDNDGDLDILMTDGSDTVSNSKIYRNNGDNSFSYQNNISLDEIRLGSTVWGDYDRDGDLDILLTGYSSHGPMSKIYRNNGDNSFSEQTDIPLPGVSNSYAAWLDYDNDGDLDILLSGSTSSERISKIYRNNGDNSFTEQTEIALTGISLGSIDMGDYDNDGHLDILLTGFADTENSGYEKICKIYHNNGNNSFTEHTNLTLPALGNSAVAWADCDNDGDLDMLVTGYTSSNEEISRIYINNQLTKNTAPSYPSGLTAHMSNKNLILNWEMALDTETPQLGLSYNLRVGTTPGAGDIFSPMSLSDGKHSIVDHGNVGHNTTWNIDLSGYVPLPENIYYSVQSIDNGYLASEWSPEISEISNFAADFLPLQTCQNTETQFQDKSFSNDYPIATYLWEFIEGSTITTSAQQNPTYTFHSFGTHYVKLTITNSDNASTSTLKSFNVIPSPLVDFTAPAVCQGTPILFDNITSANTTNIEEWVWDFGDETANSPLEEPGSHPYLVPDDYTVTLIANSSNGCSGTIEKTVSVATIPQAVIIASTPLSFCAGGSVILSTAKNSNYLYHWKNNGTAIANAVSDSLTVNQQGTYTVEVVNSIANCMANSDPAIITIQPAPAPPLITPDENKSFCDGDSLMLSVTNTPGNNYFWKLNGGAVGLNSNIYAAKSAGTYSLEVTNSFDCSANSTNTINVNVHPNPTPPALSIEGEKAFCLGDSLKISVINNPDYSYQWMNNGVNISGETNNLFTAFNSGSYNLKISNSNLCEIESEIVQVTTKEIPDAPYINLSSVSPEFCQGDSIRLFITETPNYTYEWKQNGGAIGSGPSLYAKNPGEYSLLVENSIGCGNMATNSVQVIVNPLPDISPVSLSSSKEFCENETLVMSVPFNNLYTYQWSNEYGPIIDSTENSLSTSISGNYFVSISNQNGCKISTPPIKVTAKAIPTAPSIITENYIPGECAKDSPITLRVEQTDLDYDYQWKRNGIKLGSENQTYLQGYLSMGEYTVEAINAGCMNESPVQTIFFEDAPEKPDIVAEGPTVWYIACSNDSASNYWWFYNGEEISGADEYIYVANQNLGTYSVNIGNEKGCITSSDQITIPTGATGIDDMYSLNNLTLSPNPTKGILRVDMNNKLIGQLDIKIFTFEGKQIVHKQLEKSDQYFQTELDLSDQVDGIYLIVFMIEKYVTIEKIVVN